jgi:hypothetical protein
MPGFGSGLASGLSALATGALEGRAISMREILAEKARKEADARQAAAQQLQQDEFNERKEQSRIGNLMKGYTPASTSITTEPDQPPVNTDVISDPSKSFGDALSGGMGPFAPASSPDAGSGDHAPPLTSLDTPPTVPSLGSVPRVKVINTPENYDPTQSGAAAMLGIKGDQSRHLAADRQTAQLAAIALRDMDAADRADAANRSREKVGAGHDAARRATAGAAVGRPLTETAKEAAKAKMLDGLMQYHGSEGALRSYLDDSDVGKGAVQKFGITDADITAAVGRATGHRVDQVVHADPRHPMRAIARSDSARTAIVNRMHGGSATTSAPGTETPPNAAGPGGASPAAAPAGGADPLAQQRADYDAAAAALTKQKKNPADVLGPRP